MLSIDYHVTLQAQSLKQFRLCLWTSSCHGNNSLWFDCIHSYLKLLNLNFDKLALRVNFKFKLVFSQFDLIFILLLDKFKLSLLPDFLRINLELSLINLGLSFYQVSFCLGLGVGNSETSGANTLVLSFEFPEVLVDFLILNLRVYLKSLKNAIRFLL